MRHRRPRSVAAPTASLAVAALVLSVLVVGSSTAVAADRPDANGADACDVLAAPTADEAGELARECDSRVEVLEERTPWETSYVTEAGKSVLEISVYPTRTDVNGDWEPIDTSLQRSARAGAELDVAAPVLDMQLNGGDTGETKPLGVIESNGHTFKVWFPLPLPEPTVEENRATYELARGVRVVTYVSPSGTGFTPVVELDDREAADWLRQELEAARSKGNLPGSGFDIPLRFEVSDGLTAEAMADGTVHVTDPDGNIVFQAPPAYMWDSSGALPTEPRLPGEEQATAPHGDRAEWAWPGDVVAQMPVRVDGSSMVLSPSADILEDANTAWPVHIDPGFSGQGAADWTMLRTGGYTSSMYRFTDLSSSYPGGGVGRCVGSSACGVNYYIGRLVWEFRGLNSIASLVGSDVDSATFSVWGTSSYNCNPATTELWWTGGINSSSTWTNTGWLGGQSSNTSAQRDGCGQGQGWRDFDALGMLRHTADVDATQITMGLKAADEGSMAGWKRFRNDAKLSVTYNRPPNAPTNVKLSNPSKACASGSSRPQINTKTPTISGTLSDPDGGTVYPSFQVYKVSDGSQVWASAPAGVASGGGVSATVTTTLADGVAYGYRITSHDGAKWSGWSTATCEFVVDTVKPSRPQIVASFGGDAIYESGEERGGVGLSGRFTIRAFASDVTELRYRFSTDSVERRVSFSSPNPAPLEVSFTPTVAGPAALTAEVSDAAGNRSESVTYIFDVAAPKQAGLWKLDDGWGGNAADSGAGTPVNPLGITGATWAIGPETMFGGRSDDKALSFNGSSAFAAGAPAVKTTGAFSVSARVWLSQSSINANNGYTSYTAVSQDGPSQSEFTLGYEPGCTGNQGCWSFRMPDTDFAPTSVAARSDGGVLGDGWVQLVGIYDPAAAGGAKVRLWTCDIGTPTDPGTGIPASFESIRWGSGWTSGGAFTLGRARFDSWWPGLIDQVEVFNGVVLTEDIVARGCLGAAGVTQRSAGAIQ